MTYVALARIISVETDLPKPDRIVSKVFVEVEDLGGARARSRSVRQEIHKCASSAKAKY